MVKQVVEETEQRRDGLYSIYDKDMEMFSMPFVARNDVHAKKIFAASVPEGSTIEEFDLYKVGYFNNETAVVTGVPPFCLKME